jgi:hypothetical protein
MKNFAFWDAIPCSLLNVKQLIFNDTLRFVQVSCLVCTVNLNIEATSHSETFVDYQRTARRYVPYDETQNLYAVISMI